MSTTVGGSPANPRPAHLVGACRTFSIEDLLWIAQQFDIGAIDSLMEFVDKGNINLHTFQINCDAGAVYLLQRINTDVFTEPHQLMEAMTTWLDAQRAYLASPKGSGVTSWEPITLVDTLAGHKYLDLSDDSGPSVWRLMFKIPETICYKSLGQVLEADARAALATEVGRGLALNADLTSGINVAELKPSMPGYRDAEVYFNQYRAVIAEVRSLEHAVPYLPTDALVRSSTENFFIVKASPSEYARRKSDPDLAFCRELAESRLEVGNVFRTALAAKTIRPTAIHGDTKIENFLFSRHTGQVRSLVDLDTIMPFTWLADWGDMLRSLVNVAGEKETDASLIQVDREIYAAVTKGFLETAKEVTSTEINLMVESVKALTWEIGLRFLCDYYRGDSYFNLGPNDPPDLNKTRAIAQFTLLLRLEECDDWAEATVRASASAAV